jgi:hypothetical protein
MNGRIILGKFNFDMETTPTCNLFKNVIMPKIVVLFLLLLSIQTKGQFTPTFNDTLMAFGIGSNNFDGICQDDSFYYVLGGTNNYDPVWGNMVLKLDRSFNVVSQRKYLDTLWERHDYPYNTVVVNKNQIVLCPQITKNPNTPFTVYGQIIALNKNTLDTLWTKVIEHPDTAYVNLPNAIVFSDLTSIKETPDKGYILTGNYNLQCSGADKRSFLLKIDSLGNVEWRRTYTNVAYLFDVELTQDGGFIVINKYGGTNIVVLDSLGNYLWSKKANNYIGVGTSGDLCFVGNNSYVITTPYMYNTNTSNPLMGVNIWKINLNTKQIEFDKSYVLYKNIDCIGLHDDIGIETTSNGNIIVNGTLEKYGSDKSAFILKLNLNGDSLWTKTYRFKNSNSTRSQLNDLLLCDDGGFLGVGYYSPSPGSNSSAWMFKTDANGVLGFESSRVESSRFKVFPNPAREYITFEFQQGIEQDAALRLYNALGQMVLEEKLNKGMQQIQISLKGMQPGIYLLQVRDRNGVVSTKKFVKE